MFQILPYTESKYRRPCRWHGTTFSKSRLVRHRSQSFSHIYLGHEAINTAVNCITMHKRILMYSEPVIQNLDNLRPEPERSSLTHRTRNGILTVKPLHLLLAPFMNSTDTSTVCRDYVELFSMNVNVKVFLHSLSLYYSM